MNVIDSNNLERDAGGKRLPLFRSALATATADHVVIKIPSWRPDVEGKADIVEEILRIAGIDVSRRGRCRATIMQDRRAGSDPFAKARPRRQTGAGFAWPGRGRHLVLRRKGTAVLFGAAPPVELANPIAAELSAMRPSLLPGLVAAAQRNADRGMGDVALFEVGQIFKGADEKDQFIAAAGVRRGAAKPQGAGRHWAAPASNVDTYDAKATP